MKTITQSIGTRQIVSLVFSILLMANASAQKIAQTQTVIKERIPEEEMPGYIAPGGGKSGRSPAGSISVAENSTYNAYNASQLVKNVLVTGCLQADNVRFGYYKKGTIFNPGWTWNDHTWSNTAGDRMLGYFNKGTSNFPIEEGLILSTGKISSAMGPNSVGSKSDQMVNVASDPDLAVITGKTMYDAAVLEFDFIPAGNTVEFKYVFASEEYIEYCETDFNDAFGFFLSGPGISGTYTNNAVNLAIIPVNIPVSVNTIHPAGTNVNNFTFPAENAQYYIDNPSGSPTMEFDGSTVQLTATYNVTPCQTYRIKMAIADASDQNWDAGVFLSAKSFNSETLSLIHYGNNILDNNNIFEGCLNNKLVVIRQTTDLSQPYDVDLILAGSAINGTDILTSGGQPFPTQITIPAGQASYEIPYYAVDDGAGDNNETFIVKVRNSCPCDANIVYVEKIIRIYEQVTIASLVAQNASCNGDNNGVITVNATGGSGAYEYSINNGTAWQTTNTFSGLTAGNYTILVRDPGSCYNPVSGTTTVGQPTPIDANAGPDVAICSGSSTQLSGSGGVLYSWSPATGLNNVNIANPVASPTTTTIYTLTVTNASGQCPDSDQVTVTVNPSPTVNVTPGEVEICRGENATLTASGANSYIWNPGGATTASITITPNSNANYTVIGTAANGCTAEASATVVVKSVPINVSAGADAVIGLCEVHQLQGSATGTNLTYSWMPAANLSNANIANPVFTPTTSGTFIYNITVTGENGCSATDQVSITVAQELTASAEVENNSCPNILDGSIDLTVNGGTAPYGFAWTGPSGFTANIEDISNLVAGTYQVVITDTDGCTKIVSYVVSTVPDVIFPTASNPSDIQLTVCNQSFPAPDPLVVTDEYDNCGAPVVAWVSDADAIVNGCIETIIRTYSVTDGSENSIHVTQNLIRTVDTELPVISTLSQNADLGCNPTIEAPEFTVTDNCSVTSLIDVQTIGAVATTGCGWSQTWTANVSDDCNNPAEPVSITYTWTVDTEKPVIATTATNSDLGCNPDVVAPLFTVTDNCSTGITPVVTTDGPSNTGCAYTQTWTANFTDACNNVADALSITYTWTVDTEVPVITTLAESGDLGYNPTFTAPTFTGLDNCEGTFIPVVTTDGPTSDGCNYTQTWTANYTDACENAALPVSITYTWIENTGTPVISTVAQSGDKGCNPNIVAPEFTGTDGCEGTFVPNVTTEGPANQGCSYTQTWTATYTNAAGTAATPVSITYTWTVDTEAPVITNTPPTIIQADCGTSFDMLPWQLPEFSDNCGTVVPVSDVIDPPAAVPLPATYTRTWIVTDECGNPASFVQTIQVNSCEQEFCTVTQYTLGSSTGSFCDGTSSYDLMTSLLQQNGELVSGLPVNNRSFTVPVVGGAQCIIDRFPSWNNAFVLTGNYGCGNFGDLLQPDGRFNNTLLVEAITLQFNLWMTPALGNLLLESPEFYIRSSSGCGDENDYPLNDSTHYQIHQSVYDYLGNDPTVQDLLDLGNMALGTATLPGPNAPSLANIKYAIKWINDGFENCGFIYFIPPASNKIELVKTGVKIDNEPFGIDNPGDQISYSFTVSNVSNLTLENVFIDDPLVTVIGGPIASLAPGATDNTTFTALYELTQADIDAGSFTNTATVFGTAGVNAYVDTDSDVQVFTQTSRVLNVTVFLEGLYTGPGMMRQASNEAGPQFGAGVADQITVELHYVSDYDSIVFSDVVNLSVNGQASVLVPYVHSGSYYLTVRHRNSIETTSAVPISMSSNTVNYAFDAPSKAYGNNLLMMISGEYVIFGGDANQDGIIDTGDMTLVDNSAASFTIGYVNSDVNGDGVVDTSDMTIIDNNASGFVVSITP
jgi:hypothetical protein